MTQSFKGQVSDDEVKLGQTSNAKKKMFAYPIHRQFVRIIAMGVPSDDDEALKKWLKTGCEKNIILGIFFVVVN